MTYNQSLNQYVTDLFAQHDKPLQVAWEETPKKGLPSISVKPEEGRFLQFLVKASGATMALELGTLGGYSGIWIARGLSEGGKLISVEVDPRHAEVAREHISNAGLSDRVEVRVGNAQQLLPELVAEGPFDFIFIDADKPGYPGYYEWAVENTRIGGLIAAHNAFRGGKVLDPQYSDELVEIMRAFNQRVAADPRVLSTVYPAGDGTIIAVRIS
ncbi:MAG: O-methyltransferase [Anaerolineales bacterium]